MNIDADAMQRPLRFGLLQQRFAAGIIDDDIAGRYHWRLGGVDIAWLATEWQGGKQFFRIGVLRRVQQILGAALFDNRAFFHHHDTAGITCHHRQIVADEENGGAFRPRQLHHQLHDIALDDRVKRRRRLIGDQQSGFQQHDRGQHDALAHAAGKLVRIGRQRTFWIADADPAQHVENFLAALLRRQFGMKDQPLLQLPAYRHRWV